MNGPIPGVRGIHHVAYVVADLDAALREFGERFGARVVAREVMSDQEVEAAALALDHGQIELIQPTSAESGVARYLSARGPGLHHVAYSVADIALALAALRASGARLIDERPRRGLGGHLIAFVHPESAGGALTELVEDEPAAGGGGSH